jgi:tRNA nucleotidyltransferase (CCA-adding enzyme)
MLDIPPGARKILRPLAARAAKLGLPVYAVGGCVRDWILGAESHDLDLVCEKDPAPLAEFCGKLLGVKPQAFGRFGTLRVVGREWRVDFARSRSEEYPEPASLPRVRPASLREDLFRRDFTINAMAARVGSEKTGKLVDPYGGLKDLKAKVLRVLHPASFRDDPTRVLRAARFLCRFGLAPAPGLLVKARAALKAGHAARLSRHRLAQELLRVLGEKDPACPLDRLEEWGYLALIHPGLGRPSRALSEPLERLGALALGLGLEEGLKFLRSLPLERPAAQAIQEALKLAAAKASPRGELSATASRLIEAAIPGLPKSALRPLWLNGADIKALGIAEGRRYSDILDEAAAAQWKGEISSREEALEWLRDWVGA